MDKLSEGITSAFNTAGTEANKAKLQTEIAMKQHQIKGIKQEFGVRGQRMKSNGRRGAPAPPAVAAPRARRVSEPPLLNHGLRGRHRRDVSTTAWRCGLSPIDSASTAALSPSNDFVKNYPGAPDSVVELHTGPVCNTWHASV